MSKHHYRKPAAKPVCPCGHATTDALWVLDIQGDRPIRVHRPCGQAILKNAPKGTQGKIRPSRELKEIHKKQRYERELSSSFWNSKLEGVKGKSLQDLVKTAPDRQS